MWAQWLMGLWALKLALQANVGPGAERRWALSVQCVGCTLDVMKTIFVLAPLLVAVAVIVACGDNDGATPSESATASPTPTARPVVRDVCGENPDPATDAELVVTSPEAGDAVETPLVVRGESPEFDGRVWFRLLNEEGSLILEAGGSTNFGHIIPPFEKSLNIEVAERQEVCLQVFRQQPSAGGETDFVQIPIALLPSETLTDLPDDEDYHCPENPDPASPAVVVIDTPRPGDVVSSPLVIAGAAAAFEAVIQITVVDAKGNEIIDQSDLTEEGQTLSRFDAAIAFVVEQETDACLQVYMYSLQDGSPTNIAQVPVVLTPVE